MNINHGIQLILSLPIKIAMLDEGVKNDAKM